MAHVRLKLVIVACVVSLAIGLLAYAGVRKAQVYYLEVDAFLADATFHGQRVRLCGTVGQEGLATDPAKMTARFPLLGRTQRVAVEYKGVQPDMFRAGADVVAEGRLDETGVFRATQLMTKCASKYRPANYPAGAVPKP